MELNNVTSIGYKRQAVKKKYLESLKLRVMDFDNNLSPVDPIIKVSCISNILLSVVLCKTLKPNGKFSGNLWVQQRQRRNRTLSGYLYLFALNWKGDSQEYLKESLSSILCFIIQGKRSSRKGLILKFILLRDWVSCLHARNEIGRFFVSNSKYVVCFNKCFVGKGGLYEFIMLCNIRA